MPTKNSMPMATAAVGCGAGEPVDAMYCTVPAKPVIFCQPVIRNSAISSRRANRIKASL
ncbi:hypothetical protein D3C71_2234840 [compost metagenome]